MIAAPWAIKAPRLCAWRVPNLQQYDATRYERRTKGHRADSLGAFTHRGLPDGPPRHTKQCNWPDPPLPRDRSPGSEPEAQEIVHVVEVRHNAFRDIGHVGAASLVAEHRTFHVVACQMTARYGFTSTRREAVFLISAGFSIAESAASGVHQLKKG